VTAGAGESTKTLYRGFVDEGNLSKGKRYCQNSTENSIPSCVHPNMIWNWVLPFDSNNEFHAHPNNGIENSGHFLSIVNLEFYIQFISNLKFLHPNRPLGYSYGTWL
jgi:hypothetical protein